MSNRGCSRLNAALEATLSLAAVIGAICLLAAVAAIVFGLKPVVFRSGSMSPTIGTGALAIVHDVPSRDLRVRDIVTVQTNTGSVVTHRIVDLSRQGNIAELRLKGDANQARDAQTYAVSHAGRVVFQVPFLGRVLSWVNQPLGLFTLGLMTALLLLLMLRRGPSGPTRPGRDRSSPGIRRRTDATRSRSLRSVSVLTVVGVLGLAGPATAAAWTDGVDVSGTTLTAYLVPKPVWVSCTPSGFLAKTITIVWKAVSSPYPLDYVARVDGGDALPVDDKGTTRQVELKPGLLSLGTSTIRVTAKLPTPNGAWVSADMTQTVTFVTAIIASCGSHT